MYHGIKDKSSMNYWFEFMDNNDFENLFYKIYPLIEDRFKELFPQMLKEYQKELNEKINVDVQTTLNGKITNFSGLKDDIQKMINDNLRLK